MFAQSQDLAGIHAPDFTGGSLWINSEPLSIATLRGSAVLVDIWTYTCVNCLRVLPHVREWHERYRDAGLAVIGVHTPEFDFEKSPANVQRAVHRLGITYPVVLDNDYRIWQAYANHAWPHRYLIGPTGLIAYDHSGEGEYAETERHIQALIRELRPGIDLPPIPDVHEHIGGVCYPFTGEIYGGYARGAIGNPGGYIEDTTARYTDPGVYTDGRVYLNGHWNAQPEYLRQASSDLSDEPYLSLAYHGLELNMVSSGGAGGANVFVTIDGSPVLPQMAGLDMMVEQNGQRSYLRVAEPRLYSVVRQAQYGRHSLKMWSDSEHLKVYAFTFGGCVGDAPVRG